MKSSVFRQALTGWARPEEESNPEHFRCYRRFTTAVGIALLHSDNESTCVRPSNYLACDLIIDLDRSSSEHLSLLREVTKSTREVLKATNLEEGYPFFTFASMILAQIAKDWTSAEAAATQLILDEKSVRANESLNWMIKDDRFLLGLSNYDQLHSDWISFAHDLINPTAHEDTQLVIDTFKIMEKTSQESQ